MVRKSRFRNFAIGSPMLWIAIFVVVPYIIVVLFSFLTRDPEGIVRWEFTLANYREIISPVFLRVCKNSFILALGTTAITLLTAYPFAYILTRIDENIRRFLLLLMIIPFWTSSLIRTYALIILLKANGILNTLLLSLGLIDEPLSILYTETAVFIGLVYTLLPFMILPLYASLQKLDRSFIEAARDLGLPPGTCSSTSSCRSRCPGSLREAPWSSCLRSASSTSRICWAEPGRCSSAISSRISSSPQATGPLARRPA